MRVELYPVYSLYIRFKLKTPVFCKTEIVYEQSSQSNVIFPPSVSEGYGVCKTIEISSDSLYTLFDDAFKCTIQVLRRFDTIKKMLVEMVIELYVLEHIQAPKVESFIFLTRRVLDIPMRLEKSSHVHRPVFFDSAVFCAVTLTIHSSLVSVVPVRKKLPPDPPTTDKLYKYHKSLCYIILSTKSSLQKFIRRYSSALSSPLHFVGFDLEEECQKREDQFRRCNNGWAELEQNAAVLSRIISQLFAQLVQMFSRSPQTARMLYEEFDQMRMKRLGELFVFTENPICNLLSSEECTSATQIIEQIRKSSYYMQIPAMDFYCSGTDLGPENRSIILEEIYLPNGNPNQSLSLFSDSKNFDYSVKDIGKAKTSSHKTQSCVVNFCIPRKCSTVEEPYILRPPSISMNSIKNANFELEIGNYDIALLCRKIYSNQSIVLGFFVVLMWVHNTDENDRCRDMGKLSIRRMSDPGLKGYSDIESEQCLQFHQDPELRKAHSVIDVPTLMETSFEDDFMFLPPSSSSSSLSQKLVEEGENEDEVCDELRVKRNVLKQRTSTNLDSSIMVLVHCKEHLKQKLRALDFQGYFYSDLAHIPYRTPYFLGDGKNVNRRCSDIHLIVLVHGLEGSVEDLGHYRNVLRLLLPEGNLHFLPSCVNLSKTWSGLEDLATNLLYEVYDEIKNLSAWPARISFIAHSMGGLIIRAMLGLPKAAPLLPMLYTLLTLNAPHCGLLYNQRAAKLGVSFMRWWKQSVSLEQLCLRDAVLFRDTFLYKLSTNGVLGKFRYVLLVGSCQDFYVPLHSAMITSCKAASKDRSTQRSIFDEMVSHMNTSMENSELKTTVVKYTVYHSFANSSVRTYQVIGKAAHIAVIDDDVFVERLLALSAVRYFI